MATKNDSAGSPSYYPPVGFHFEVKGLGKDIDANFQSVSGLSAQLQTETYREGGQNRYEHTLPVRAKYSDLALKRGVVKVGASDLSKWFKSAFDDFKFKGKDLTVTLLNEKHEPLTAWKVINALPKNWKINDMNAERSEILIESMELSYNYFEFMDV